MLFELLIFSMAFFLLFSAFFVVYSNNPVHSVLFLILVFFNAIGLLLIFNVEFLAMIFLIIYVGAIAVLFLFVVMMLNVRIVVLSGNFLRFLPIGCIAGFIFFLEIFLIFFKSFNIDLDLNDLNFSLNRFNVAVNSIFYDSPDDLYNLLFSEKVTNKNNFLFYFFDGSFLLEWAFFLDVIENIIALSEIAFVYNFICFLISSLILLVAMIGSIVLTIHSYELKFSRKQIIHNQLMRKNNIFLLKEKKNN